MSINQLLPLLIVLSAILPGVAIFCIGDHRVQLRRILNIGGNILCLALIVLLIRGVHQGEIFETRLPLLPGMDLVLHADALSLLFVSLSGFLWLLTTIYAIGYLGNTQHRSRFFGFFSLCVGATVGIALAGNLITFLIFYELLTLTTYPLVVHKGNAASLRAGKIYLGYTMLGGALLLAGVVWLKALAGPLDFTATGILSSLPGLDPNHLIIIFILLMTGLGVKAALVPLHGWLPTAMAAPAPVSALLHAVAVVKAGAFGIIRVVYDVYGIEFARDLGLTPVLALFAAATIIYGSVRAVFQDDLKKRLAFSTVSQVSYIALGTAIAGPIATIGGMVHLVHQGIMKITLFFCAGNFAETLGVLKVSEMNGIGKKMPITMAAFTIAALGMIGIPPVAGFVSKWYLATGALEVQAYWVLVVLAGSSLLNAIYFLPILHVAWFKEPNPAWPAKTGRFEAPWMLIIPPAITAMLAVAVGVFASSEVSPLSWAKLIAAKEYGQEWTRSAVQVASASPLILATVLTPLLFSLCLAAPRCRKLVKRAVPLAVLPAIVVATMGVYESSALPGLFFFSTFGLDENSRVLLLLASTLWLIASFYSADYLKNDKNPARYSLFFLLCMTGSFGLILSQEILGFIAFFTLMSLSAYGLVIHSGSADSLKAGRLYIQWVIVGELLLFAAIVGVALDGSAESFADINKKTQPIWVSWLLVIGFGIKAGLLGVHFWLPRAHPVAPVPASALLSGLMVKAGLIGWWRFLPLGEATLLDIGGGLIFLGLCGTFLAVVIGLMQQNPKALLAYSTISQMGILAAGVGAGLIAPSMWIVLSSALLIYAVHHGLAKAALFLGVGVAPLLGADNSNKRRLVLALLIIPAVAMVGLPFTSGAIAKTALKTSLENLPWFTQVLPISAIGTTLLMLRFLDLLWRTNKSPSPNPALTNSGLLAYGVLVFTVIGMVFWLPQSQPFIAATFYSGSIWNSLWPVMLGAVIYLFGRNDLFKNSFLFNTSSFDVEKTFSKYWAAFTDMTYARLGRTWELLFIKYKSLASPYFYLTRSLESVKGKNSNSIPLSIQLLHPGLLFLGVLACMILLLAFAS